jgi:hypothetical protein
MARGSCAFNSWPRRGGSRRYGRGRGNVRLVSIEIVSAFEEVRLERRELVGRPMCDLPDRAAMSVFLAELQLAQQIDDPHPFLRPRLKSESRAATTLALVGAIGAWPVPIRTHLSRQGHNAVPCAQSAAKAALAGDLLVDRPTTHRTELDRRDRRVSDGDRKKESAHEP